MRARSEPLCAAVAACQVDTEKLTMLSSFLPSLCSYQIYVVVTCGLPSGGPRAIRLVVSTLSLNSEGAFLVACFMIGEGMCDLEEEQNSNALHYSVIFILLCFISNILASSDNKKTNLLIHENVLAQALLVSG